MQTQDTELQSDGGRGGMGAAVGQRREKGDFYVYFAKLNPTF